MEVSRLDLSRCAESVGIRFQFARISRVLDQARCLIDIMVFCKHPIIIAREKWLGLSSMLMRISHLNEHGWK